MMLVTSTANFWSRLTNTLHPPNCKSPPPLDAISVLCALYRRPQLPLRPIASILHSVTILLISSNWTLSYVRLSTPSTCICIALTLRIIPLVTHSTPRSQHQPTTSASASDAVLGFPLSCLPSSALVPRLTARLPRPVSRCLASPRLVRLPATNEAEAKAKATDAPHRNATKTTSTNDDKTKEPRNHSDNLRISSQCTRTTAIDAKSSFQV